MYDDGNLAGANTAESFFLKTPIELVGDIDASDMKHDSEAAKSDAYSWSFSASIPESYEVDTNDHKTFPTAPSFKRSMVGETVEYQLVLTLKKGALKTNET